MEHDERLAILDSSQGRMAGDVLVLTRRVDRLEAVMFGPGEDESGGLRASIASMSTKMDKEIALLNAKMDQMTFWFRIGAFGIIIFLTLFGPPQVREVIQILKKVP